MDYITYQDELDDNVDVSTMDDPEEEGIIPPDDEELDEQDEIAPGITTDEM